MTPESALALAAAIRAALAAPEAHPALRAALRTHGAPTLRPDRELWEAWNIEPWRAAEASPEDIRRFLAHLAGGEGDLIAYARDSGALAILAARLEAGLSAA